MIRTSVLCLVLLAAGAVARADDLAAEADLHFRIGTERYQAGDYRGALEHFLASNRLVPNRNVVFNIARSYEQLKKFPDAYRGYATALELEPDAKVRAGIEAALLRIMPKDRKSTRLNSSHIQKSRMPSSA